MEVGRKSIVKNNCNRQSKVNRVNSSDSSFSGKMTLPGRIFRPWDEPKLGCTNLSKTTTTTTPGSEQPANGHGHCNGHINHISSGDDEIAVHPLPSTSSSPNVESGKQAGNFPFSPSMPSKVQSQSTSPNYESSSAVQSGRVKKLKLKLKKVKKVATTSGQNNSSMVNSEPDLSSAHQSNNQCSTKSKSKSEPCDDDLQRHSSGTKNNSSGSNRNNNNNNHHNHHSELDGATIPSSMCCSARLSPNMDVDSDYHLSSSDSPLHSNQHLFLYPLAINELANMSRHELTVMGLLPPEPPSSVHKVKRQRPKRFHCPHCQVAFSNNGQLRGHIRIHTGERPFVCEQDGCEKSFTRNEELTRHRRIHTGLRPFPCSYCGKKFGRKDHLKKHTRTHQRVMYSTPSSMIGYGHPFQPFHPPILSSSSSAAGVGLGSVNDLSSLSALHPSSYSFLPTAMPLSHHHHPHHSHQPYYPTPL